MAGVGSFLKKFVLLGAWALTLSACEFSIRKAARNPDSTHSSGNPSDLIWSDLDHDFGQVDLDTNSSPMTFTLTNTGESVATGCSPVTLSNSTDFFIASDSCGANDMPASGACLIVIRGKPGTEGLRTTTLTRSCSTGGTASTTTNQITVTGVIPALAWAPLSHSFGSVNAGAHSNHFSFTLTNSGAGSATGCSSPVLSNSTDFSIQNDSCSSSNLGSGNTCTVEVRANPSTIGAKSTTLSRTCTHGGTVSTTALQITVTGTQPFLAFSPLTHSFGTVDVGSNSSTQTFTLSNSGSGPATGCSAPTLSNLSDFTIVTETCLTADLAAASSCAVVIRANPASSGALSTTLSRTCATGGTVSTTTNQITVTGNPVSPVWSPLASNFGMVVAGSNSSAQTFTLTNFSPSGMSGCLAPSLSNTTDFTLLADTCGTGNLASGAACTVQVQANPAATGLKTATLSRACTTGGTISTTANQLTVTGTLPALSWSPLTYDFSGVNVGSDSTSQAFTLTNSGTASATGCSAPAIDNTADFTIVSDTCGTANLAPSSSCTVSLRANPQALGPAVVNLSRSCSLGGIPATNPNAITVTGTSPVLSVSPLSISFGSIAVGNTSASQVITFSNSGSGPATGCAAASLTNPTDFSIVSDSCGTSNLAASSSCTVTVVANPAASGSKSSTLNRTCAQGGSFSSALDATGIPPTLIQFTDAGQWGNAPRTGFSLRASACTGAPMPGCASSGTIGVPVGSPITLSRTINGVLSTTGTHSVTLTTKPVTATSAQFTPGTITVTFNPGDSTKTIDSSQFSIVANATITADTYFVIDITAPTNGAQIGSAFRAQVNLVDPNYLAPAYAGGGNVLFTDPLYSADPGGNSVTLTLHRAFQTGTTEEFDLQLFDGDGICGVDYTLPGGGSCTPNSRTGGYVHSTAITFTPSTTNQELQISIPLVTNATAQSQARNTSFYAQIKARSGANPGKPRSQSIAKVRILNLNTSGSSCNPTATTPFGGGLGTSADPYLICSSSQWAAMLNPASCGTVTPGGVASGGSDCQSSSVHFKLMVDMPPSWVLTSFGGFSANLDGNQRILYNFYNFPPAGEGLFTVTNPAGATLIRSLNLHHAYQSMTNSCRGLLIGNNSGTGGYGSRLSDVFVSGYLEATGGTSGHGLIAGCMNANSNPANLSIERGMTHGMVRTTSTNSSRIGGIVGGQTWNGSPSMSTNMDISKSHSTVNIIGPSQFAGGAIGFVGQNSSIDIGGTTLSQIQSTGFIDGESYVGGIAGRLATRRINTGTQATFLLARNTFTGSVTLEASGDHYAGGILGGINCTPCSYSNFTLNENHSHGSILSGYGGKLGGILGGFDSSLNTSHTTLSVTNNIASGKILGSSQSAASGGLLGNLNHNASSSVSGGGSFNANSVTITGNSASGPVAISPADRLGGLIGSVFANLAEISIAQNMASGDVTGNSSCGGIFGQLTTQSASVGQIASSDNVSSGTVRASGSDIGGFAGFIRENVAFLRDKANSPVVSIGNATTNLGGFAGTAQDVVEFDKCQSNGSITQDAPTSYGNYAGGFVGRLTSSGGGVSITKSWTTSNITLGDVSVATIGGFIGLSASGSHTISQSFVADTSIDSAGSAGNNYIGGFVGLVQAGGLTLDAVYTAASLSGASGAVRGFEGSTSGALSITDSYYLNSGSSAQPAITGLSQPLLPQMQDANSGIYSPSSWDSNFTSNSAWVAPNSLGIMPCSTAGCPTPYYSLPVLIYP